MLHMWLDNAACNTRHLLLCCVSRLGVWAHDRVHGTCMGISAHLDSSAAQPASLCVHAHSTNGHNFSPEWFTDCVVIPTCMHCAVGEEVIAIPPPRPKRKPARPYPRNQRGATNGGGSTSCNEGISENNCGAEYSQPQMGGTTANTNTMGQSNLSSQVHLPQPYHAANGAGGRSNCGPSEMEMGGAMCMAQDQDDGEVRAAALDQQSSWQASRLRPVMPEFPHLVLWGVEARIGWGLSMCVRLQCCAVLQLRALAS